LVKVEKIVEVGVCFGLADGCDLHEKKGLPRGWSRDEGKRGRLRKKQVRCSLFARRLELRLDMIAPLDPCACT